MDIGGRGKQRRRLAVCTAIAVLAMLLPVSAAADPVPLAQVGSAGSGAGQLSSPFGVALDGAGRLYVAERFNHRISVFAADGSFIRAFGWGVDTGASAFEVCTTASTCQTGSSGGGGGQLSFPLGVAVDSAGNLYVADAGNARISVFGTAGPSFIRAFGWGVDTGTAAFEACTTASTCQAGGPGGGAGQLDNPAGVALDGEGDLYVADAANSRISVFGTAGPSFTRAFGWGVRTGAAALEVCTKSSTCQTGSSGGGAGQLDGPVAVALDGDGNLYVAEISNERISVFDPLGPLFIHAFGRGVDTGAPTFETCTEASGCQQGGQGGGAGWFTGPRGVALDSAGQLYVADDNQRISVFDPAGPSFTSAFGWDVADPDGNASFELCPAQGSCRTGDVGGAAGQLNGPRELATDCRDAVWVPEEANGRVQRFGEPGTALPPCGGGGGGTPPTTPPAGLTGLRAAAIKKCAKKHPKGPRRKKCIKRAKKLPA